MTTTILAAIIAFGELGRPETFAVQRFPYRGDVFTSFVDDSYKANNQTNPKGFYEWFEGAAKANGMPDGVLTTLSKYSAKIKADKDPQKRAADEKELAELVHKTIKAAIPKFSLERGFEFTNTVGLGERQCLLQSVLLAGLMQKAGVDTGVAMVWKNLSHQEINNGHVVNVERLANGNDLIVDCSDPTPFVKHEGLFMGNGKGSYAFVSLVFDGDDVKGYTSKGSGLPIHTKGLDVQFLRSQFDYYRGERAPHGFFSLPRTPEGIENSAMYLRRSIKDCPVNPLAVYVLGHVYRMQKKADLAKQQYAQAYALYGKFGWIPDGPKEAYASTK